MVLRWFRAGIWRRGERIRVVGEVLFGKAAAMMKLLMLGALSRNCATARCGDSVIPEPGLSRGALSQLDPWMLNGARGSLLELPPSLLQTPPPFLDR